MDEAKHLWQLEEQFWLDDAGFYERTLAPKALMVLPPPVGILDRAATVAAIRSGARWRTAVLSQRHAVFPGPDTAVLAYGVRARRDGAGSEYLAQCSSTYVRAADGWRLALHHQTPS